MFVSIRTKLFILLVLANAVMVAALLTLNAVTFSHSFSSYVAQQESRKLAVLIDTIATRYDVLRIFHALRPKRYQKKLRDFLLLLLS